MVSNKAIRSALYQALNVSGVTTQLGSGSASLVHGVSPPSSDYPICLFNRQSDVSRLNFGGNAFDEQLWLVKGVVRATSASIAEDIDKAVRDILDFGTLTVTGGTLLFLARTSGVEYTETDGDQTYRHAGSIYRLTIS